MQLSEWRMLKNTNDVLKELQKNSSEVVFRQRVMIAAAAICPRYGDPGLSETRRVLEEAKSLKNRLLTGSQTDLTLPENKKREVFPEEVHHLAKDCWLTKSTIVEPAKYRKPAAAPTDGCEVLPTRLQTMTDDEAYEQFSEHYRVMKARCDKIKEKYRANTEYNQKMKERLTKQESWFPGKLWFLKQKPIETEMNMDHTTGLCKDCHSNQLNYSTVLNKAKQLCSCRSTSCPNWVCLCDGEDCTCLHDCACDDCKTCKVMIILNKETIRLTVCMCVHMFLCMCLCICMCRCLYVNVCVCCFSLYVRVFHCVYLSLLD